MKLTPEARFTAEEIKQAAQDELNAWKFKSKKWTNNDFQYYGFVASVIHRLTNPSPPKADTDAK